MACLKSPCTTSYRSSIDTIALNCLVFEKSRFCIFSDRQTDIIDAWSRSLIKNQQCNQEASVHDTEATQCCCSDSHSKTQIQTIITDTTYILKTQRYVRIELLTETKSTLSGELFYSMNWQGDWVTKCSSTLNDTQRRMTARSHNNHYVNANCATSMTLTYVPTEDRRLSWL